VPTARLWTLLACSALFALGARVTVAAPETCPEPEAAPARAAAVAAARWLVANQHADGTYAYAVDRAGDDVGGYNNVRHAGVTLSLYQAAAVEPKGERGRFAAAADRALDWMLDRLRRRDDWAALSEGNVAPLGGSALMLAALEERRALTDDDRHDEVMRELGNFLVAMQRENGDFYVSYGLATGGPDRAGISQYYAGESLWALARLQNALPDPGYRRAAERAANYVATGRDDRDFVPVGPLNDHWAAYGFAEMATWPISDAEATYARDLHARFDLLIRWEAQKDGGAPYRRTHGPVRRAAALGTWVEGQAALTRLARADDRLADLRERALESTACGAGVLVERQHESDDERVAGAWFTGDETRMDDQQHAISGLLALADLLEARA
jgi:hypothetical protein